jgi:hypothetical protein
MKTNRSKVAVLALAAIACVAVVLYATLGASASRPASAFARGQKLGAGAYFAHGKLRFPSAIADRIDALNGALDACYLSHGAKRVPLQNGAWTYADPAGAAATACSVQQDAVNAFANGAVMRGAASAATPLLQAFYACLGNSPAVPKTDDVQFDASAQAYRAAAEACSAHANAAVGVSAP